MITPRQPDVFAFAEGAFAIQSAGGHSQAEGLSVLPERTSGL